VTPVRSLLLSGRRLLGVDVARALALLGMMSVHIFPAIRDDGSLHPAYVIAAGRSAALFATLAGVGLALTTGGSRRYTGHRLGAARVGVLLRAVLLVIIGLLLGRLNSPPLVILAYYGLLFVIAVPFLGLSARPLFCLGAASVLVAPVLSQWWRAGLDAAPVAEPGGPHLLQVLFLTGTYPAFPWTAYLFTGLAIGRLDLRRTAVAVRLLVGGLLAAVVAKVASAALLAAAGGVGPLRRSVVGDPAYDYLHDELRTRWLREGIFGTTPPGEWRWLLISTPHSSTPFDLLHTVGTSAAVLGACLLLVRVLPRGLYLPLAATGSMTLTLYSLHVIALRNGNPLIWTTHPAQLWWSHVVVAVVLASVWRAAVGRGPLEWLAATLDRLGRRAAGDRAVSAGARDPAEV
jgi:uncharacterized membrane protein